MRNSEGSVALRAKDIPVFSLYGETAPVDGTEFVHIEEIRARSERYDWHIEPHQHRGLCQVLFVLRGAVEVQADGHVEKIKVPCALSLPPAVVHALKFRPGTQGLYPHHVGGHAAARRPPRAHRGAVSSNRA